MESIALGRRSGNRGDKIQLIIRAHDAPVLQVDRSLGVPSEHSRAPLRNCLRLPEVPKAAGTIHVSLGVQPLRQSMM